jgi:hypothetical protein
MLNRIKVWALSAAALGGILFHSCGGLGLSDNIYFRVIRGILNEELFG